MARHDFGTSTRVLCGSVRDLRQLAAPGPQRSRPRFEDLDVGVRRHSGKQRTWPGIMEMMRTLVVTALMNPINYHDRNNDDENNDDNYNDHKHLWQ